MPNQDVTTTFRFVTDRTATNATVRDEQRIEDAMNDVTAAEKKKAQTATNAENTVTRAAKAQADAFASQSKIVKQQADLYGDVASRTMSISNLISGLGGGALSGGLMLGSDFLDAAEGVQKLGSELPALTSQMIAGAGGIGQFAASAGLITVALAGTVLAVKAFSKGISDANAAATQAVNETVDAIMKYREFLATAPTSDVLQKEVQRIANENEQLRMALEEIGGVQAKIKDGLLVDGDALTDLSAAAFRMADAAGVNISGTEDVEAAWQALNARIQTNEIYMDSLNQAYMEGATIAADAAAQQEKANQTFSSSVDGFIQSEVNLQTQIETLTTAQAEARAKAIDIEQAAIEKQLASVAEFGRLTGASEQEITQKTVDLNRQLSILATEEQQLTTTIIPAIKAREAENKEIAKTSTALNMLQAGLATGIPQALQKAATSEMKYQHDRTADIKKFTEDRTKIEDELETVLAQKYVEDEQARLDHQDALADIQTRGEDAITKEAEDFQTAEEDRQLDYQRKRERAERDHKDNLNDAAAKLDAIAVINEMRNYNKQKREDETQFSDETRTRTREHNRRMSVLRRQLNDQLQAERDNYQRQRQQDREAFQRRQTDQANALRTELTQLANAHQAKLTANATAHAQEITQLLTFQDQEAIERKKYFDQILAQWKSMQAGGLGGAVGGKLGGSGVKTLDIGGYGGGVRATRSDEFMLAPHTTAMLEQGMGSLTQSKVQQLYNTRTAGPITMNFGNIGNYAPAKIKRLVHEALLEVLEG